jgi:Fe-S-cluster formation regulator IscX/YfhJ
MTGRTLYLPLSQRFNQVIPRKIKKVAGLNSSLPQMPSVDSQAMKVTPGGRMHVDKGNVKSALRMCYDLSINMTNDPKLRLAQVHQKVVELEDRFNKDPATLKEIMNSKEKEEYENTIHKIRVKGLDYIAEEIENEKRSKLQPKKTNKYDFLEAIEYNLRTTKRTDDVRDRPSCLGRKLDVPKQTEIIMNSKGRIIHLNELDKNFSTDVKSYIGEIDHLQAGIKSSIVTDSNRDEVLNELNRAVQGEDCDAVTRILRNNPDLVNHEYSVYWVFND